MSTRRSLIVEALAQVPGLSPYPDQPATVLPGSAWPVLRTAAPHTLAAPLAYSYDVYTVLAADPAAGTEQAETLLEPVSAVLSEIGEITWPADVVTLVLDTTTQTPVPAIRIRVTPHE